MYTSHIHVNQIVFKTFQTYMYKCKCENVWMQRKRAWRAGHKYIRISRNCLIKALTLHLVLHFFYVLITLVLYINHMYNMYCSYTNLSTLVLSTTLRDSEVVYEHLVLVHTVALALTHLLLLLQLNRMEVVYTIVYVIMWMYMYIPQCVYRYLYKYIKII